MDVDAAIEFLLQNGARLDARQDRFDQQLRTMARLGMAMSRRAFKAIDALAEEQRATEAQLRETEAQLQETDKRLRALIDQLRLRGGNGHPPA